MKLIEITPKSLRCGIAACPAIYETDNDTYIVIGRQLSQDKIKDFLKGKVGIGETAVEFPKELLKNLLQR